jgi:uncharacterized protein (TIGR03000 family)
MRNLRQVFASVSHPAAFGPCAASLYWCGPHWWSHGNGGYWPNPYASFYGGYGGYPSAGSYGGYGGYAYPPGSYGGYGGSNYASAYGGGSYGGSSGGNPYGGGVSYSAPSSYPYAGQGALPAKNTEAPLAEQAPPSAQVARIEVTVPADADVWFNGKKSESTGVQRDYTTGQLKEGETITCRVVATWGAGRRVVREVQLTAGQTAVIDCTLERPTTTIRSSAQPQ